jgi:hypothetical protein
MRGGRSCRARATTTTAFVYGGLVFQTLTRDYLTTWDKWWNKAPGFLNYYYLELHARPNRTAWS